MIEIDFLPVLAACLSFLVAETPDERQAIGRTAAFLAVTAAQDGRSMADLMAEGEAAFRSVGPNSSDFRDCRELAGGLPPVE